MLTQLKLLCFMILRGAHASIGVNDKLDIIVLSRSLHARTFDGPSLLHPAVLVSRNVDSQVELALNSHLFKRKTTEADPASGSQTTSTTKPEAGSQKQATEKETSKKDPTQKETTKQEPSEKEANKQGPTEKKTNGKDPTSAESTKTDPTKESTTVQESTKNEKTKESKEEKELNDYCQEVDVANAYGSKYQPFKDKSLDKLSDKKVEDKLRADCYKYQDKHAKDYTPDGQKEPTYNNQEGHFKKVSNFSGGRIPGTKDAYAVNCDITDVHDDRFYTDPTAVGAAKYGTHPDPDFSFKFASSRKGVTNVPESVLDTCSKRTVPN